MIDNKSKLKVPFYMPLKNPPTHLNPKILWLNQIHPFNTNSNRKTMMDLKKCNQSEGLIQDIECDDDDDDLIIENI